MAEQNSTSKQGSSTKQLVATLGFGDLMGSAVGQIIGAGIMSLLPAALAMTGRSVPFAFLIAACITVCQAIPYIFISSVARFRGGMYSMLAAVAGEKFVGMYVITSILSNVSLAMYGLSLGSYLCSLFGWDPSMEKIVALVVLTAFLGLNLVGVDAFAKVQNLLVIVLIGSLLMFGFMGIGRVQWGTYFVKDEGWMLGGLMGLFQAGGLLTFATGGATTVCNFSCEAKNPTRDIPVVIIISTLGVAVLYGILAFVAAGVLPLDQVLGKNLTVVAGEILARPAYIVFIIGGAGCALASTLNNQLATTPKPIMQMCDDGWLPASFAALNKKKVPYKIIMLLYVIAVICVVSGLSISVLSNICILASAVTNVVMFWNIRRIPEVFPHAWAKSKFKVGQGVLTLLAAVSVCASLFNSYLNASNLSTTLLILNVCLIGAAFVFGVVKNKTVHVEPSYEELNLND